MLISEHPVAMLISEHPVAMLISEHPVAIVKCRTVITELILSFISVICRIVSHVYLHT